MSEADAQATRARRFYRVSELLGGLNALLEERVGRVWVIGEVGNFHRAASGHCYFTLKDESGQLRAALFRRAADTIPFEIENGLEVVAYAEVSIYPARGELQLVVHKLEPRGRGALQLAFEQLRARLAAEGLFDAERKRAKPGFPRRVGVVTSPTSAAVRDVIEVSGRRSPGTALLISPTRVQGEGAEHEIAAALDAVSRQPEIDLVLLVRGGGSLEDLWAFNTDAVARAIERCPVPVIAGVGHETDLTIADLVADLRAPTPSAAAEHAFADQVEIAVGLQRDGRRLASAVRSRLAEARQHLAAGRSRLRLLSPGARLAAQRQRIEAAAEGLLRVTALQQERRRSGLAQAAGRLDSLSPLAVLGRGYALATRARDGAIVRAASEVAVGEVLDLRLGEGVLEARVEAHPEPED
ncbi:MAG: exodeoxyribonuclease VII large subunit [Myxococcota bacterium]|nr:exodeoxyribonuclease VII large subunit [Myxococcota bacterium]